MTPINGEQVSNQELKNLIKALDRRQEGFEKDFKKHDDLERQFQRDYWERHSLVNESSLSAHRRIDALNITLCKLSDDYRALTNQISTEYKEFSGKIEPYTLINKGILWVGGSLAVSIIALIWALITGQATIIFH